MRDDDPRTSTSRRSFLRALTLGVASPLAGSQLIACDAGESEQAEAAATHEAMPPSPLASPLVSPLAQALARDFAYLDIAPEVYDRFAGEFERAYGNWQPGQANKPHARFLASTDFFQHGGDEARALNFVRFYDPYRSPCYNPFSNPGDGRT